MSVIFNYFLCPQWWWRPQEAAGRTLEKLLDLLSRNLMLYLGQIKKIVRTMLCVEKEAINPLTCKSKTYFHSVRVPSKATLWCELYLSIKDRMAEAWKIDGQLFKRFQLICPSVLALLQTHDHH